MRAGLNCTKRVSYGFSGGHHKPYDWREDHALNPYFEVDPRTVGIPNSYEYGQPFEASQGTHISPYPESYNPKDLTLNFVGTVQRLNVGEGNLLEPHHQNIWDDVAHEWDYES